ncbi:MAG: FAD-dependent oxidoreductase [Syntrophobacteraceae bacterium]
MMRKNLAKLVEHINMLNLRCKEDSPEYLLLKNIVTDEMIDIALKMKLRTPMDMEDLAKKTGKPLEAVIALTEQMADIGLIEYTLVDGKEKVMLPLFAPGIMELMVMNVEQIENHPEIAQSFKDFVENLVKRFAKYFPNGTGLARVVPVERAIDAETRKVSIEELSYWVEKYAPSLAVTGCQCRRAARMLGEAGSDLEGEWCITVGKFAESCIRTNRARRITKEETYDILRRAEELGYVHQVTNVDGPKNSLFICNCHYETCLGLRTSWLVDTPNMSRSNFIAKVDKDKCTACGQCVEVCPQNAVKLGQKICQEKPVKIRKNISPDDHLWGKDKWRTDFLTTRKNVIPETGTSPCKTECPAHISVQGYIKLASQGKYTDALELIKKDNPLPAVCGRICPRKCESVCTRSDIDDPVAIDEIKKFIAEKDMDNATRFIPKKMFTEGKQIAVIGCGPAGLSCAYYLAIYGHRVTVFEKQDKLGGMLRLGIPAFRLEKDVIDAEIDILKELGVEFKTGVDVGKDVTLQSLREHGYKGFYIAIGAHGGRRLGIEGEDAGGVISGVDFLRNVALDKPDALSGDVVVIGGGNVAIDVARTAVRNGATTLTMYCLESAAEMPALPEEIEEAASENIRINNSWGPKRIIAENGKATGIEFKRCTSVMDAGGRFAPQYDDKDTITVKADYVLVSVGQSIHWGNLLEGANVVLNPDKTAQADGFTYATAQEDVFVGGDAYSGPKYAIDAIAAGKQGADSLHRFVWEGHDLILGRDRREYHSIDKDNLLIGGYDTTPRQRPIQKPGAEITFKDARQTFSDEQIKEETKRCLSCGAAYVDETRCLGCGLCTTRCKFEAITLSKKFDAYGVTYEQLPITLAKNIVARGGKIAVRKAKDLFSKE